MFILGNYSASEYPKLYGKSEYIDPTKQLRRKFRRQFTLNIMIALMGFAILLSMAVSGYSPSQIKENGHLALVILFFVVQAIPYILTSMTTQKWQKNMRQYDRPTTRTADLRPRKLFDFVSPAFIGAAILSYALCLTYYFYNKGFSTPWDWQTYMTVIVMTAVNLAMIICGTYILRGRKIDPHQTHKDQHKLIETMIRVFIFASIIMSLQLIVFDAINQNGWDMYEPIAISIHNQIIIIFGIGEILRRITVKNTDFNVYRHTPVT